MKINWPVWPRYSEEHRSAILRVIDSNQLYAADEVAAFENEFSRYVGADYCIGMGNATQGLQLALAALGIGIGDEVLVTPYSWISSASCVLMQNAVPVFVDIETETFGLCPHALKKAITPRTKAVILVHMFGLCSKIREILEICKNQGIHLIEDASHSHGARFQGRHLGTFGKIGVFSLHQRKAISTGDGGILCTQDQEVARRLKQLRSFGNDQLSYNYRMTEFSAALGRVGLRHLDKQNDLRRWNHTRLAQTANCEHLSVVEPMEGVIPVYYSNLIRINLPKDKQNRLLEKANEGGIPLKRTWQPLHQHPHFQRKNMINSWAPWDFKGAPFAEPANLRLPNSEKYQKEILFELDCHPMVEVEKVEQAGIWLREGATRGL